MYKCNNCTKIGQFFDGGETKGVAQKVVTVYTNPCAFGNGNFSTGDSNLRIDAQNGFDHPGNVSSALNPLSNHAYATFVAATMCKGTQLFADSDTDLKYDLNPFFNDVPSGVFDVSSTGCWPLFCKQSKNSD